MMSAKPSRPEATRAPPSNNPQGLPPDARNNTRATSPSPSHEPPKPHTQQNNDRSTTSRRPTTTSSQPISFFTRIHLLSLAGTFGLEFGHLHLVLELQLLHHTTISRVMKNYDDGHPVE